MAITFPRLLLIAALTLALAACSEDSPTPEPTPTPVVIVVTATPRAAPPPTPTPILPTPMPSPTPVVVIVTATPTATPPPTPTPIPPTPVPPTPVPPTPTPPTSTPESTPASADVPIGLANGQLVVRFSDYSGDGMTYLVRLPDVPTSPQIYSVHVTRRSFTINWDSPQGYRGCPCEYRWRKANTDWLEGEVRGHTFSKEHLEEGASYYFQVRVKSGFLRPGLYEPGAWSPEIEIIPTTPPPPLPEELTPEEQAQRAVVKIYKETEIGVWHPATGVLFHTEHHRGYILTDYRFLLDATRYYVVVEDDRFNRKLVQTDSEGTLEWRTDDTGIRYQSWGTSPTASIQNIDHHLGLTVLTICCAYRYELSNSVGISKQSSQYESLTFTAAPSVDTDVFVIGNPTNGNLGSFPDTGWDDATTFTRGVTTAMSRADGAYYPVETIKADLSLHAGHIGAPLLSKDGHILVSSNPEFSGRDAGHIIASEEIIPVLSDLIKQLPFTWWETGGPVEYHGFSMVHESNPEGSSFLGRATETHMGLWIHRQGVFDILNGIPAYRGVLLSVTHDSRWIMTIERTDKGGSALESLRTLGAGNLLQEGVLFNTGNGQMNHIMLIAKGNETFEFFVNGAYMPVDLEEQDLEELNHSMKERQVIGVGILPSTLELPSTWSLWRRKS